jgi:hypothetical protein
VKFGPNVQNPALKSIEMRTLFMPSENNAFKMLIKMRRKWLNSNLHQIKIPAKFEVLKCPHCCDINPQTS